MRPSILIFMMFFSPVSQSQSIDIVRGLHDVFWVSGSINNNQFPINFIVDSGATHTTISAEVAQKLGLDDSENCDEFYKMITSNGESIQCVKNVEKVQISNFVFRNVKIYISKNMTHQALLGNDILHQFLLIQHGISGQILTLSR